MSKFVLTAQLQLQAPRNTQQVINQLRGQLQGAVNIPVNVQGAVQATKQINQVNQAAQKATTAGERMGKAFGASIKRFAAFNIATRAVGLLASKLSQAVDESIAFQRELIKISQVTGKTVSQLESLTGTITKLSTTLGVSSTSLLQTSRILAQAGIEANDLDVALSALAKTTLAPTFDNITETAEGAVAILAQFGQGVGALETQLGAINAVAGQFAVESGDLISAVRRTGGVFRQAGGDLNELLGLFTSVRATTRENAESIATGLRTIFTRIQRPQTIEYLKQFGVQLTDLEGRFVGPFEAVRQLSTALAGLEQGDIRFVQIAEELGGFRQIGKVIPLIQQFEVAERARQAAIDGGNSLTEDAATAQQALAVQIEKTREKFLALIRSISETSTFQIMIKSVLGIANAFIKVAEAIKPILPLIAAFAAVKLTRGLGSFVSGIGAGIRGKNQGGQIHAFASGGFVPGTGNRDTVPAMLTPGEFVIRKSSVNKIGAGTLAAMNENKYADGGTVKVKNPEKYAAFVLDSRSGNDIAVEPTAMSSSASKAIGIKLGRIVDPSVSLNAKQFKNVVGTSRSGTKFGTLFKNNSANRAKLEASYIEQNPGKPVNNKTLQEYAGYTKTKPVKGEEDTYQIQGPFPVFGIGSPSSVQSDLKEEFAKGSRAALEVGARSLEPYLSENLSVGNLKFKQDAFNLDDVLEGAAPTIEGYMLEAVIGAVGDLKTGGTKGSGIRADFDFPSVTATSKEKLSNLFDPNDDISKVSKADAKRTRATAADTKSGIVNKIAKDLAKGEFNIIPPVKKASGGGISGSDTVPAMLTPGEFVINKKASQSIGYGNLNRMNKQGVVGYANGGPVGVQYFAEGGGATGGGNLGDILAAAGITAETEKASDDLSTLDFDPVVAKIDELIDSTNNKSDELLAKLGEIIAAVEKGPTREKIADGTRKQLISKGLEPGIADKLGTAQLTDIKTKAELVPKKGGQRGAHLRGVASELNEPKPNPADKRTTNDCRCEFEAAKKIIKAIGQSAGKIVGAIKGKSVTSPMTPSSDAEAPVSAPVAVKDKGVEKASQTSASADKSVALLLAVPAVTAGLDQMTQSADGTSNALNRAVKSIGAVGTSFVAAKATFDQFAPSIKTFLKLGDEVQFTFGNMLKTAFSKDGLTGFFTNIQKGNKGTVGGAIGQATADAGGKLKTAFTQLAGKSKILTGLQAGMAAVTSANTAATSTNTGATIAESAADAVSTVTTGGETAGRWVHIGAIIAETKARLANTRLGRGIKRSFDFIRRGAEQLKGSFGKIAGTIGKGVIAAGVTKIFSSIVDSIADNEGAIKRATERGDVDAAGAAAGEKAIQDGVNNVAVSVGGALAMIPAIGPVIGSIIGGGLKLAGQIPIIGDLIGEVGSFFGELFGGETYEAAVARARVEAGLVKIQKEFASNAKSAAFALKDVENGAMGIREAFASGVFDQNAASAVQVAQDAEAFVQEKEAQRPGIGRSIADWTPILGWFVDSVDEVNAQLDKEIEEMEKKSLDTRQKAVEDLQPAFKSLATNIAVSNGSFEDFEKALSPAQKALLETESDVKGADGENLTFLELQKQTTLNQIKATQENIKYLKSLNFGLTEVIGKAEALSGSLDRLVASQETGYNGFDQAASVLEQSLTNAAANMNPKDIQLAQETLADTLRSYGADEAQVKQATESAKALTAAQSFAGDALRQAADKLAAGGEGGATKIKQEFSKQIEGELDNLGVSDQTKKRILDSLGKVDFGSEEVQQQLASGNFQAIIDQAFGPLSEEVKKQVLPALQERAKQEKVLIDLTRQKIQLEKAANEAKKKAIDIELEAAQAIADFGGRSVTTADKIDAANRQLNIDLGAAGIRAGAGTPRELAAGLQQIQAGFNQIEVSKQTAGAGVARGGAKGAFGGVAGVEADRSEQLAQASQALIEFSRKRINLIKEELDIIKKKNALEKSSLDKLLGGDVAGFFKDQAAAGAAVALRTGNTDLLGSFGASAIGAGFQSLEGQGLSDQQMRRASGAALGSLGITDTRSADILGGTTAQEQALKQEGQQFAQILGAAGQLQADVAEMRVTTKNVIIQAAKATMNEGAPAGMPVTGVTPGFAHGGVVYANRGMFVPRGTDTVPAMLTPGEFVVNRAAVQRGNNMAILQAMNNGQQASGPAMSRGGTVRYYRDGGDVSGGGMGISMEVANKMAGSLNGFVTAVDKLGQMQLSVKLDTTNVNVNFNGTSFLANLSENIKTEVLNEVRRQIPNIQHSGTGGHQLGGGSVMGS